ncbi:helix-turn-helix domain-containing protein [Dyadobacter fanqingshengii]|uniref:helix-turn-helix domain-containing protein n=1 Tax=Dyadobacter fanqingshengii TaxID=2906443 RepID=UPI0035B686B7
MSSSTGLTPVTISNIFNGDTAPHTVNLIQILEKMQRSMTIFGKYYDNVSKDDLRDFENHIIARKRTGTAKKQF